MVSLFAALLFSVDHQATSQMKLAGSWDRVAPTVGILSSGGRPTGLAVVVSADGVLLAHQDSVALGPTLKVLLSGPVELDAKVVGRDPVTGLIGLKVDRWPRNRSFAPVAAADPTPNALLVAATLAGPLQGQTAQNARGFIGSSNRYVPLIEIRFEQTSDRVAGAILFDQNGSLVGVLGATLARDTKPSAMSFGTGGGAAPKKAMSMDSYGPQSLTTAYALGTPVLARVVKGFASPSHQVKHPTIGIGFRDENGINRVTSVEPGSAAFEAGLREGDVVVSVGSREVKSSLDLASALFELELGTVTDIAVLRNGQNVALKVKVSTR